MSAVIGTVVRTEGTHREGGTLLLVGVSLFSWVAAWLSLSRAPAFDVGRDVMASWPAPWVSGGLDAALVRAEIEGKLTFVYARDGGASSRALEEEAAIDPLVAPLLDSFVCVALDLETRDGWRDARSIEALAAPALLVLDASGGVVDAVGAVTGSRVDRYALVYELERILRLEGGLAARRAEHAPSDPTSMWRLWKKLRECERWGAAGEVSRQLLAADPHGATTGGRMLHLYECIEDWCHATGQDSSDRRIQELLEREPDELVAFEGWRWLADTLDETGDGRRSLEASREAWKRCPEELVRPYGGALVARFARHADRLDSIDRLFVQAVGRTVVRAAGDHPHATGAQQTAVLGAR